MNNRQLLIWTIIMGSASVFMLYKFARKGSKAPQVNPATSYDTTKVGNVLITKPNNNAKSYNIIFVFGGTSYANKEWMKSQMPKSYFTHNIVVLSNYTDSFSYAQKQLEAFLKDNGLTKGYVSLIGFSAGGINVLNSYDKGFKFVGLIDPSNKPKHSNIDFGKNAYMVFNKENWGSYPIIKANMDKVAHKVVNGGGYANSTSMSHREIPKFFFINFSDIHRQ